MSETPEPVEEQDASEISDLEVSEAAAESVKGGGEKVPAVTVPPPTSSLRMRTLERDPSVAGQ